ncbi:MAG: NYN domain-containing protein [Oligoflexia bacterium]|nr:NYN domain-containing protein [Oligoflexia bacterium]
MKKIIIYIDGFNLYYRLKTTPYKWLNIQKLCKFYFNPKQHDIIKIKYFTAKVRRKSEDSSNVIRQNIYLRALETLPNLEIIFGQFRKRQVIGLKCHYERGKYTEGNELVTVSKWEEKESDVNIATHIVADAFKDEFDCAVLISNDTDLKTPLGYIKEHLKKSVGIISPRRNMHIELKNVSHFQKRISNKVLEQFQFPEKMKDDKGEFFCPPKWKQIRDQKT